MRLIAKKPCSFGGKKFFIGDDIPVYLVADPDVQEKLGVLAIVEDENGSNTPDSVPGQGKIYSQEEVSVMIAEAVAKVEREKEACIAELQKHAAELAETQPGAFESTVPVTVFGDKEDMAIRLSPEEIHQVFSVLQLNAEEGIKMISGITSENALILIHATDGRKTVKTAAKEQADKLFTIESASDVPPAGNATTDTNPEGS